MQGQMTKLFRGMFSLNLSDKKELKYWAGHWNITTEQLSEAATLATSQSVNAIQQILYRLGYLYPPEGSD